MKKKIFLLVIFLLAFVVSVTTAQISTHAVNLQGGAHTSQRQDPPKAENKPPQFDNEQYQFGLLSRGPKWTAENTPEIQKIQEGHMANINRMAQLGKLIAAGPVIDNGDL